MRGFSVVEVNDPAGGSIKGSLCRGKMRETESNGSFNHIRNGKVSDQGGTKDMLISRGAGDCRMKHSSVQTIFIGIGAIMIDAFAFRILGIFPLGPTKRAIQDAASFD